MKSHFAMVNLVRFLHRRQPALTGPRMQEIYHAGWDQARGNDYLTPVQLRRVFSGKKTLLKEFIAASATGEYRAELRRLQIIAQHVRDKADIWNRGRPYPPNKKRK